MTILCCERTIKLWKPAIHENGFEKNRHGVIIVIAVWLVCVGVSALPLTGYGEADYIPLQQRCVIHDDNHIHMHLLFVFGIYIPSTIVCLCGIFTYTRKRQIVLSLSKLNKQVENINMKLTKTADENSAASSPKRHSSERNDLSVSEIIEGSTQGISHTATESVLIQEGKSVTSRDYRTVSEPIHHMSHDDASTDVTPDREDDVSSKVSQPMTPRTVNDTKIEILSSGINRDKTKLSKVKVMFNVYQSSAEERDITLTVSYILMFLVVLGLWLPYVVLLYLDNDEGTVWGGWFSLVVLLSDISYCIKPVVYLSHNRVLKKAAMASFPESVRKRAAKTQEALKTISKKLDSLVFIRMPDTKSLIDIERDRVRVSPTV
ncbi:uncharacterized protein LOC117329988 [Pecten maximus]|uniref:uncharacterized protein LOC117329988 n=1 Tax=Pecten maximus TaxID=6579 RepID=UPI0014591452|nr:uncharacterized protein LOC117329988 [Pecten maximus]